MHGGQCWRRSGPIRERSVIVIPIPKPAGDYPNQGAHDRKQDVGHDPPHVAGALAVSWMLATFAMWLKQIYKITYPNTEIYVGLLNQRNVLCLNRNHLFRSIRLCFAHNALPTQRNLQNWLVREQLMEAIKANLLSHQIGSFQSEVPVLVEVRDPGR